MASYRDKLGIGSMDGKNKGFFSKILRNVSNWGMDTESLIKNSHAVGVNQTATPTGSYDNMYDLFSQRAVAKLLQEKSIAYLDRSYQEKMRILREYSRKDEIRNFIRMVADEAIMYDDDDDFCHPIELSEDFDKDLRKRYNENYDSIYRKLGFNDGIIAWNYFKSLLIDGYLAFEIVYDEKYKKIIGFNQLEPYTLLPGIDPSSGDSIWIQYPESPEFRRVLLDSQIIYISYSSGFEYGEISYVENLIRPYNQLKILEQTRIMFNLANAMSYKKFIIPVNDMPRAMAEQQIGQLIADYKDEVTFDEDFGTVQVNGSPHISYNKEYWFPNSPSGTPTVEIMNQQGHNLNENDMLTWFYNALKRESMIPFNRFDKSNGGGNIFGDSTEVTRDELSFFSFIQRLRTIFKEIIIKPWKIQMCMEYPELIDDDKFMTSISVKFNATNLFHEWKKTANLLKKADLVGTLLSSITNKDGEAYFSVDLLVREHMDLTEEFLEENERWKLKTGSGSGEPSGANDASGGGDFGGGDFGDTGTGGEESGDFSADTGEADLVSDATGTSDTTSTTDEMDF